MLDIGSPELLLVAIVAIVVIGPKDLPKALRLLGYWVGRGRGVMRQFRSGFDAMVREAELAEMEKRWAEENKRIMAEHPAEDGPGPVIDHGAAAVEGSGAGSLEGEHDAPLMVEKPRLVEPPKSADEPELPLAAREERGS